MNFTTRTLVVGALAGTSLLSACGQTTTASGGTSPTIPASTVAPSATSSAAGTLPASSGTPGTQEPGGSASISTSVTASHEGATKVTTANLPTAAQIRQDHVSYRVTGTVTGEGQATMSQCQRISWAQLKPNASFSRTFDGTSVGEDFGQAGASIASFTSHADAVAAAQQMAAGFTSCDARVKAANPDLTYAKSTSRTVTLPSGETAHLNVLNVVDGETSKASVEQAAVVARGTHVELLVIGMPTEAPLGDDDVLAAVTQAVKTL